MNQNEEQTAQGAKYSAIIAEVSGGVATLTLNRPAQKNALDLTLRRELGDAVRAIRDDRNVCAVIIKGAGGAFCAGGDLRSMNIASPEAGRNRLDDLHAWLPILLSLDRPVIAAVDGVAYGAGFSLALTADYIIASRNARFCMPFIRVGLLPDWAALYTLPRAVGMQRAKDILISAREIGPDEAHRIGIAAEVVEPAELDERAKAVAGALAAASSVAVGLTKRALNVSFESDLWSMLNHESAGQGVAFMTDYHREAIQRFKDKAPPLFSWPAAKHE